MRIVYVFFGDLSSPYGPIRAHMGPARALEEREKFRKKIFFAQHMCFFSSKIVDFNLHMTLVYRFNVFFRFLTEIRFRTIMKLPQKTNSETKMCSSRTPVTLP